MSPTSETATFLRPREGRMVVGVCAALARRIGWDVTVVRVLFALLTLATFGVLAAIYLILGLALPAERAENS